MTRGRERFDLSIELPSWRHMPDITGYIARQQLVLRAGRPRVDLAIYRHGYWEAGGEPNVLWSDSGLRRAGHSYDFVGPRLLELSNARVAAGRLDPDGPAYRALLLNHQTSLPLRTAQQILGYAREGLPIIVVGPAPSRTESFADADALDAALGYVIAELLAQPNVVHVAAEADVPEALTAVGVTPTAAYGAPVDLLSVHRADAHADYYWCFNAGTEPVDVDVSLQGRGRPYTLDAWTGAIRPMAEFTSDGRRLVVRVLLAAKQTTIIAITPSDMPEVPPLMCIEAMAPVPLDRRDHTRRDGGRAHRRPQTPTGPKQRATQSGTG